MGKTLISEASANLPPVFGTCPRQKSPGYPLWTDSHGGQIPSRIADKAQLTEMSHWQGEPGGSGQDHQRALITRVVCSDKGQDQLCH